ncbi:hypothetical protein EDD68_1093 [Melghiribacillus thermohalophilus]|uniref:Uncharacterized protein n=1 Tax=Melghiribacillus thermohalophilus TaxID=1324956 RepID=A0A4R3N280_9BACI|nr:hypothetical protein EDD68_1093 [Melghiribacillus thermohalophilus]
MILSIIELKADFVNPPDLLLINNETARKGKNVSVLPVKVGIYP